MKLHKWDLDYKMTVSEIREAIAKHFDISLYLWDVAEYQYLTDKASWKARRESIKRLLIEVPMPYSIQYEIKDWLKRKEQNELSGQEES